MADEQAEVTPLHITVDMEKNVFSQSGEDGIIEVVLTALGGDRARGDVARGFAGLCIEIGANNGVYCSNTANLRAKGWSSLLIEREYTHYELLSQLPGATVCIEEITAENAVKTVNTWPFAHDCDVLSCDIDGDDVEIVKALIHADIRPKVLVIEYNPTFPPFLYRNNPLGTSKGSSLKCVIDDLNELEYDCVYATISNVILIDRRLNPEGSRIRPMNAFEAFRWDAVRFVVSDFDGQNHLATMTEVVETITNPWDNLPSAKAMQYPKRLLGFNHNRKERANYNHWGL